MNKNSELQRDVQNAIKWEPSMYATEIGVTAKDGVVTLSGVVDSYSKKLNAAQAAKNVVGVKALTEEITIDDGTSIKKNDTEIVNEILNTWKHNREVLEDKISVTVEDGWVKLEGEVPWKYQQEASMNAIHHLTGVRGVTNLIKINSESKDILEKKDVISALKRNWSIYAKDVNVEVNQHKVKLTGLVHSIYQKEEAGRLAWNAPGVWSVENELAVIC